MYIRKYKKSKYMVLTEIGICSRIKVDIENHYLCFFNVAIEEKLKSFFFLYMFNGHI